MADVYEFSEAREEKEKNLQELTVWLEQSEIKEKTSGDRAACAGGPHSGAGSFFLLL